MEDENRTQSEEIKDEVQPRAKEEPTVTKRIEEMRKRIDQEVSQRKVSEDLDAKSQNQVKILTGKLKSQDQSKEDKIESPELDETKEENENLRAQLTRRDQMDTVVQQFNEVDVIVPKEVSKLVMPSGIDKK